MSLSPDEVLQTQRAVLARQWNASTWGWRALFFAQKQKAEDLSILGFAGWTGLEPAPFGVTGRRYNRLNYHPRGTALDCVAVGGTGLEPVTPGL